MTRLHFALILILLAEIIGLVLTYAQPVASAPPPVQAKRNFMYECLIPWNNDRWIPCRQLPWLERNA